MPIVSVLMPVFNRASLVSEAIRSIQDQTFQDWELIIVDDGSTDATLEVCKKFESQDKRIHVFANERNLGVGETRNRLTSYATGRYMAHQDSDDISIPERLQLEVEILDSKPEIALVCGLTALLDDEGRTIRCEPDNFNLLGGEQYPQQTAEMVKLLFFANRISNPTCMYRRSLLEKIPTPFGRHRFHEDWYFVIHVAHLDRIWGIPKVLAKARQGENHSHLYNYSDSMLADICRFKRDIYARYGNDASSPIDRSLFHKSIAMSLVRYGRHIGGWQGYWNIIKAVRYDPSNSWAQKSLVEFSGRALRKGIRLGRKSPRRTET